MKISLVAAIAENAAIGLGGDLPWRLPADQRHFKELTTGHCLVMGRKTFDSIGRRPLPGRLHIVISRDRTFQAEGVLVATDLDTALDLARARGEAEAFIAGGTEIYALALPLVDCLHLTRVHAEVDADTFFPPYDEREWKLVRETHHEADDRNEYSFSIQEWRRQHSA